jgi:pimeloyl-ACP methyl ester carboxylesterase
MTVVLVHGNPETPAIWGPLCAALGRDDVVTPRLPGFGQPAPPGFGAAHRDYVEWLVAELEGVVALHGPVDLVGHDWGGGFVVPVACQRPDLLRTWATDVMALYEPRYVWHDMAQVWQTPGAGEEAVAGMVQLPLADRVGLFEGLGMPPDVAADCAGALDAEMGRCILALYRSAAQPFMAGHFELLPAAAVRPGLALVPTEDPYTGGVDLHRCAAAQALARVELLDGLGHWWMLEDPDRGAEILTRFWMEAR